MKKSDEQWLIIKLFNTWELEEKLLAHTVVWLWRAIWQFYLTRQARWARMAGKKDGPLALKDRGVYFPEIEIPKIHTHPFQMSPKK